MNKYKSLWKKALSLLCAVSTAVVFSIPAFAADDVSTSPGAASGLSEATSIPSAKSVDYLNEKSSLLRETNVPTKYWELRGNPYSGVIEYLTISTLFTNYYFFPNADGKLNVSYAFHSETGAPVALVISLYDMYQKKFVASFETGYGNNISDVMHFYNLVTNRTYAVAFRCDDKTSWQTVALIGDFTIFQ